MTAITIRNLPEETHRALRVRAVINSRSTEAEIRAILEDAVRPEGRFKLGSLLAGIARRAIAVANGFQVASRDTAAFDAAGVRVINPWESAS
jgi:plasmid stability protein